MNLLRRQQLLQAKVKRLQDNADNWTDQDVDDWCDNLIELCDVNKLLGKIETKTTSFNTRTDWISHATRQDQ